MSLIVPKCETFLDLGCGPSNPFPSSKPGYLVGVDGYLPYLVEAREGPSHDDYVFADLRHLPFKDKSFDCVFAFDVLEHMTKPEGERLVREMERIARTRVVLLTPNGFNPKAELEDGNPLQAHHSGWQVEEFANWGYQVIGRNGLKVLRAEHGRIRWRPKSLWGAISVLTEPLVRVRPGAAFYLLAWKDIGS